MLSSGNMIKNYLESNIPGLGETFKITSHPEFPLAPCPHREVISPCFQTMVSASTGSSLPVA